MSSSQHSKNLLGGFPMQVVFLEQRPMHTLSTPLQQRILYLSGMCQRPRNFFTGRVVKPQSLYPKDFGGIARRELFNRYPSSVLWAYSNSNTYSCNHKLLTSQENLAFSLANFDHKIYSISVSHILFISFLIFPSVLLLLGISLLPLLILLLTLFLLLLRLLLLSLL